MAKTLAGTCKRVGLSGQRLIYLAEAYKKSGTKQSGDDLMDQLQQQIDTLIALKRGIWVARAELRDEADQFPW